MDVLSIQLNGFSKHNFALNMFYFLKDFLLLGPDLFPAESQV